MSLAPRGNRTAPLIPVAMLLAISGACALAYQMVWMRMLRGTFGASTPATAAVTALFMAGLGVGGLVFGRRADRHANPLRLYARLELGIALAALASIPLVGIVETAYFTSGGSPALGEVGATALRIALAALLLVVPTTLLGGTLPAAARSAVAPDDDARRGLGVLYGANTLGAVAGAVAATFFLVELLGHRGTLVAAALANLGVAGVARALSRELGAPPVRADEREDSGAFDSGGIAHPSTQPHVPSPGRGFIGIAAALVGFAFFLLELAWYRMLSPLLGGSTFSFGLILAVALTGIGMGGLIYGLVAGRRRASPRWFAASCGLEALAIIVPFAAGDRVAVLAALLKPLDAVGFHGTVTGWAVVCAVVVLPASLVAGFQFPALIALAGQGQRRVGGDCGWVYGANTLGAVLGAAAGGFGLLPLLGATGCWKLAAWTMAALALVAALPPRRRPTAPAPSPEAESRRSPLGGLAAPLAAGVAVVLLLVASGPTAAWRHTPIGAGRVKLADATPNAIRAWINRERLAIEWEAEGVEGGVALNAQDGLAFLVNGKSDGHFVADAPTQIMGGLLGALLHPAPRRALVIGLGTGCTAGWLAQVEGMERVDVVELEPAIIEVARRAAPVNGNCLERANLRVHVGDAREWLMVGQDHYDIVFSEPSNPYRAGVAGLFTADLYRAARERLTHGGLFLQWLQTYEIDAATVETVIATLRQAFDHVQVWQTVHRDLVLVASREAVTIDAEALARKIALEPYAMALRVAWGVDSVEGVLAHNVATDGFATAVAERGGVVINTDDRNVVEFGLARSVGLTRRFRLSQLRHYAAAHDLRAIPVRGQVDAALIRRHRTTSRLIAGSEDFEERELALLVSAHRAGRFPEVVRRWRALAMVPVSHSEVLIGAESHATLGDPACVALIAALATHDPVEAALLTGVYHDARGDNGLATDSFVEAFTRLRAWPWADHELALRALDTVRAFATERATPTEVAALAAACDSPFAVRLHEEWRRAASLDFARRLEPTGGVRTLVALDRYEPHPLWAGPFLRLRAERYRDADHPLAGLALRELAEFEAAEGGGARPAAWEAAR